MHSPELGSQQASPASDASRLAQRCCATWPSRARWMISKNRRCCRSARFCTNFRRAGTSSPRCCWARQLTGAQDGVGGYYRSRPLLLGLGTAARRGAGLHHDARRRHERRARHRRRVQSAAQSRAPACCRCAAASARSTRPAVGWAQALRYRAKVLGDTQCRGQHCRGAWRRCIDGHQRLLGGAQYRDHRATAAPVLHRGQRLRDLRAFASSKRRAATSPTIWRAFAACGCSTAMPPIR